MHQPKDIHWLGRWKHMHDVLPFTSLCLTPSNCMELFYIVKLIMFPIWIKIIFYFLSGYWLGKLINTFYYGDYVTISHFIPLHYDWSTEN